MPVHFPMSIFACWDSRTVIEAAIPLMRHYKKHGAMKDLFDKAKEFDPKTFDKDKPWFCQLWGVAGEADGKGGDQLGLAARLMDEPMVELLAYLGPTMEAYPLLMTKARFDREYELD